jgi:hypothetical protein
VGVYNIIVGDIYNYDEIGVRLGIGKKEKVIITIFKAIRITAAKNTSWESATIIKTISGNGAVLPLFIILAGIIACYYSGQFILNYSH